MFYTKQIFPKHIRYVKDTFENRIILKELLKNKSLLDINQTYIEVNFKTMEWRICFDFEWLYRDQPTLISIEELKKEIGIR